MSTVTLRYLRVLIVLAALVVPTAAAAVPVSITIDGDTFFGQDSISLGGLSPLIQPSGSPSVLTATDTPTVKSLGMTKLLPGRARCWHHAFRHRWGHFFGSAV